MDFALDWAIAGARPWFFRLRNVLYHLASALLLLALFRRWGADEPAALLGALVFAVHPVSGIPVNYLCARDLSLMALFLVAAALQYARWRRLGGIAD